VPKRGLEPRREYSHYALNVARLPIPPLRRGGFEYTDVGRRATTSLTELAAAGWNSGRAISVERLNNVVASDSEDGTDAYFPRRMPTVGHLAQITDAAFKTEIQGETPVLVDFWAEWCGPCRMVGPVLEQIAVEQTGKLKIVKLNVDENQDTPMQFGVTGIPTMILFKGGEAVERIVGFMPKPQLLGRLRPHLEAGAAQPSESAPTTA
jgi:thioredoxin 1